MESMDIKLRKLDQISLLELMKTFPVRWTTRFYYDWYFDKDGEKEKLYLCYCHCHGCYHACYYSYYCHNFICRESVQNGLLRSFLAWAPRRWQEVRTPESCTQIWLSSLKSFMRNSCHPTKFKCPRPGSASYYASYYVASIRWVRISICWNHKWVLADMSVHNGSSKNNGF